MASRRKPSRKRQQKKSDIFLWTISLISLVFTLCLCAFNFELATNGELTAAAPRLERCRAACDERAQSAAIEGTTTSALSSSALDPLFLRRDLDENTSKRKNLGSQRYELDGAGAGVDLAKSSQVRPRRLPTLIKILTGFDDDSRWYDKRNFHESGADKKPIIARIENPYKKIQTRRKRNDKVTSEDTVQMAAAAAAAAVWSRSIRIYGSNRMRRINAEWDTALRWIAGWDQQVLMDGNFASKTGDWDKHEASRVNENKSLYEDVSNSANQEGISDFIDNLANLLESCIIECLDDDNFDNRNPDEGSDRVTIGSTFIGDLVFRSIISLIAGISFPCISFGKIDTISTRYGSLVTGTFQLVFSTAAVCGLRSLWSWASMNIFRTYGSSFCGNDTPEWLLEHEREVELAKGNQNRHKKISTSKKAKKRHVYKQHSNKNKVPPPQNNFERQNSRETCNSISPADSGLITIPCPSNFDSNLNEISDHLKESERQTTNKPAIVSTNSIVADEQPQNSSLRNDEECLLFKVDNNGTTEDEHVITTNHHSDSDGEVPSIVSLSSISNSSSPTLKPIGSHMETRNIPDAAPLQGTNQTILGWNSPLDIQFGVNPLLPPHNVLPVPTQEQRNEASKQLREFQNAQIQRILFQKRLAQNLKNNVLNSVAAGRSSPVLGSSSFFPLGTSGTVAPRQDKPIMKPPPGLAHPSVTQYNLDDMAFFADNELLLSTLLDDDDDDDDGADTMAPSDPVAVESASVGSSLDPSALSFVSRRSRNKEVNFCLPESRNDRSELWPTISISKHSSDKDDVIENGNLKIKGVYGGNVW